MSSDGVLYLLHSHTGSLVLTVWLFRGNIPQSSQILRRSPRLQRVGLLPGRMPGPDSRWHRPSSDSKGMTSICHVPYTRQDGSDEWRQQCDQVSADRHATDRRGKNSTASQWVEFSRPTATTLIPERRRLAITYRPRNPLAPVTITLICRPLQASSGSVGWLLQTEHSIDAYKRVGLAIHFLNSTAIRECDQAALA